MGGFGAYEAGAVSKAICRDAGTPSIRLDCQVAPPNPTETLKGNLNTKLTVTNLDVSHPTEGLNCLRREIDADKQLC